MLPTKSSRTWSILHLAATVFFFGLFTAWMGDERGWQSPLREPVLVTGLVFIVLSARYVLK